MDTEEIIDAVADLRDARDQLEQAVDDATRAGFSVREIADALGTDTDDVERYQSGA